MRKAVRGLAYVAAGIALSTGVVMGQTLARPGWAGSGLTVSQWWRNAVLVEIVPPRAAGGAEGSSLKELTGQLDDLQTLGVDAIVLRGVVPDAGREQAGPAPKSAGPPLNAAYGTVDDFDELLREASRRRQRVLVEVPPEMGPEGAASLSRFWLSRGVSGIYVPAASAGGDVTAVWRAVRGAMHGYVGQRVLAGDAGSGGTAGKGEGPELVFSMLRGLTGGSAENLAALRSSLESMRRSSAGETVAEIDPKTPAVTGEAAKARAAVLAATPGGLVLRLSEVGLGPEAQAQVAQKAQDAADLKALAEATSPAGRGNVERAIARRKAAAPLRYDGDGVFQWTARMIGLHRGNSAMLQGTQTLVDEDGAGAMVSVWRGRTGVVLTEVVNLGGKGTKFSLKEPFAAMHLRGSFLKPMARTDGGMGAMGLDRVKLPADGVFFGELGR